MLSRTSHLVLITIYDIGRKVFIFEMRKPRLGGKIVYSRSHGKLVTEPVFTPKSESSAPGTV